MALTNVENAILQLICGEGSASGYEINRLIAERGYRHWAGIGRTSIYNSLKKLMRKGLIKERAFRKNRGKGPVPVKFSATNQGKHVLKTETLSYLSGSTGGGNAFELALASIPAAGFMESAEALKKRVRALETSLAGLKAVFREKGGRNLPVFVAALFERPMKMIEADIEYTKYLAGRLYEGKGRVQTAGYVKKEK